MEILLIIVAIIVVLALLVTLLTFGDIRRYLRMRRM